MLEQLLLDYEDIEILKADGFDEAVIGIDEDSMRLIYSVKLCLRILMRDMDETEALEYFSFNVSGAFVGEKTPIFCQDNMYGEC